MLIERDSLKYMVEGSYEWIRQETIKAIKEAKEKYTEINCRVSLVCTFPRHAIVVNEAGQFYRIQLQEMHFGDRKVISVQKMKRVPKVYKEGEENAFFHDKTKEMLDGLTQRKQL